MVRLVERQRLLAKLRQRHRLDLIALESPAGFGRSVLLDQSIAEGPARSADRDILYRCGPDDAELGHLAAGLVTACGGRHPDRAVHADDAEMAARALVAALEGAGPSDSHMALLVDDVDRGGPAGAALWPKVLERLPEKGASGFCVGSPVQAAAG